MEKRRFAVAGGHEIAFAEVGAADGMPVVFLHGSGPGASGVSNFRHNIAAFAKAGYRVLLPDLIGYGDSSKPEGIDYSMDLFVETLTDALDQAGVSAAVFVGNSLGGGIAMQMALERRTSVTALILMAPGCIEELPVYFAMPGIANMKSAFGSPEYSLADQRRLNEALVYDKRHITDALVKERFEVARTQSKDVLARMRMPNLAPRLSELTMPIFGFWGAQDDFCPVSGATRFLEACHDVRFMTFNGVGHWVQVERAAEFNAYSLAFLARLS